LGVLQALILSILRQKLF